MFRLITILSFLLMLPSVLPAQTIYSLYESTTTNRGVLGLVGNVQVAASTDTVSAPTIILNGHRQRLTVADVGRVNVSTITPTAIYSPAFYGDGSNLTGIDLTTKADKVTGAVAGDFAGLDNAGNLTDSGVSAVNFVAATTVMPTASAALLGTVVHYSGVTTSTVTAGASYKCVLSDSVGVSAAIIGIVSATIDSAVWSAAMHTTDAKTAGGAIYTWYLDNPPISGGASGWYEGTYTAENGYLYLYIGTNLSAVGVSYSGTVTAGSAIIVTWDGTTAVIPNYNNDVVGAIHNIEVAAETFKTKVGSPGIYVFEKNNNDGWAADWSLNSVEMSEGIDVYGLSYTGDNLYGGGTGDYSFRATEVGSKITVTWEQKYIWMEILYALKGSDDDSSIVYNVDSSGVLQTSNLPYTVPSAGRLLLQGKGEVSLVSSDTPVVGSRAHYYYKPATSIYTGVEYDGIPSGSVLSANSISATAETVIIFVPY